MLNVSPLAPEKFPEMPPVYGVRLGVAEAGIKYQGRTDVLLMVFEGGAEVAGVFTQSKCPSAPVDWCRQVLPKARAQAVLVNSGNANAFTGIKGWEAVRQSAEMLADLCACPVNAIYLASTGVIGEPLDASAFSHVLGTLYEKGMTASWQDAAAAIMTTDTFAKGSSTTFVLDGQTYRLNGIAKGSGMIAPDMATMLSFVVTDAPIPAPVLQNALTKVVDGSFNAVTVDGDTSTSDTVLLFATGDLSKPPDLTQSHYRSKYDLSDWKNPRFRPFKKALSDVTLDLAKQIARDGEGARKLVEISVLGAKSARSAKKVALSIANSPLVKTAIAGEDANWGRVVMAVGKAGEPADRDRLAIWFGGIRVAVNGERDPDYNEEAASHVMKHDTIKLTVDLGLGRGKATVWTCDLTKDYVAINGDYRS